MSSRERAINGYTLIELVIVTAVIAIILSVAMPRLLPAIAVSNFEGAARHLANFGRSAMAHCTLTHDRLTIKIDLDNQEYWAVRWRLLDEKLFDEEEPSEVDLFGEATTSSPDLAALAASEVDVELEAKRLQEQFDRFARLALEARAGNVKQEGILDDIGPLFDHEFDLDGSGEEDEFEEVKSNLLSRTSLPRNVAIESVVVGSTEYLRGTVEIDVTSLGLVEPVTCYVKDVQEEYYTVVWDPITGGAHLSAGKDVEL